MIGRIANVSPLGVQALARTTTSDGPSLLPPPQPNGEPMDALGFMQQLLSKQKQNDLASGKAQAAVAHNGREAARREQLDAINRQADDADTAAKWGVFGKIASAVAVAVSAVLAVCTCGAASGLCVAACVLSVAAFAEGETHALGKLTGNEDNSKWFSMGLGFASAICSGGSTLASSSATLVAKVGAAVAMAARVASPIVGATVKGTGGAVAAASIAVVGAAAGGVQGLSKAAADASKGVTDGAKVAADTAKQTSDKLQYGLDAAKASVNVTNDVAQGVVAIGQSHYEGAAIDDGADATQGKLHAQRMQRITDWIIDGIVETDKSHERALGSLQGAIQTKGQTLVTASRARV